ncbi:MAG: sulfite exporter TauE/SafE family protein [Polyangiales bacterium]
MSAALLVVVAFAFTVEAALGFGATVITLALGALMLPIGTILPAVVPLNLVLSAFLAIRHRAHVDRRLLFRGILPLVLLGMPFGMWASGALPDVVLKRIYGAFVCTLAGLELVRSRRARADVDVGPAKPWLDSALLALAGVVHGAFSTGGPLVVYVAGRRLGDKLRFRATLAGLWMTLQGILIARFAFRGDFDGETLGLSLRFALGLLVGLVVGDAIHDRISETLFRRGVFVLLGLVGAVLLVRG